MHIALKPLTKASVSSEVWIKNRIIPPNGPELWGDDEDLALEVLKLMRAEGTNAEGLYGLS